MSKDDFTRRLERSPWDAVDEANAQAEAAIKAAIEAQRKAEASGPGGPGSASEVFQQQSHRFLAAYDAWRQASEAGRALKAAADRN